MSSTNVLGHFERAVLLAIIRLDEGAYGVPIRRELETRLDRSVTVGAVYTTLDRLEGKGFVSSFYGEPTAQRGGRSKRFFRIEAPGLQALEMTDLLYANVAGLLPVGA